MDKLPVISTEFGETIGSEIHIMATAIIGGRRIVATAKFHAGDRLAVLDRYLRAAHGLAKAKEQARWIAVTPFGKYVCVATPKGYSYANYTPEIARRDQLNQQQPVSP